MVGGSKDTWRVEAKDAAKYLLVHRTTLPQQSYLSNINSALGEHSVFAT